MVDAIRRFVEALEPGAIVRVFADGACSGNPGPGGWGALLEVEGHSAEMCGGEQHTTNNRMELRAAIEALRALPPRTRVCLTTDSQYLKNGIESWLASWKRNGWRTAGKQPVKNQDLWETLDTLCRERSVSWAWVKGHSGVRENERADALARQGIIQQMMARQGTDGA